MDAVDHIVVQTNRTELVDAQAPALDRCVEKVDSYARLQIFDSRGSSSSFVLPPGICNEKFITFAPMSTPVKTRESEAAEKEIEKAPDRKKTGDKEFEGSLFLIGGKANKTVDELIKLAPKNPKVVVVGRASEIETADEDLAEDFVKAGIKVEDITIVVPKGHKSKDTKFHHAYEVPPADIVYFGGGQQDKLRREFDDHQLKQVKDLLKKGAFVGGSSAGAAVMSTEMINGGTEKKIEHMNGFGLTPWVIVDTHVGERHREERDSTALYDIGAGKLPVIGLDEDTRVRFFWKGGKLLGEIGGKGVAHWFQTADMPELSVRNRKIMSKISTDGGKRESVVWELKAGDVFEIRVSK